MLKTQRQAEMLALHEQVRALDRQQRQLTEQMQELSSVDGLEEEEALAAEEALNRLSAQRLMSQLRHDGGGLRRRS